ncbi:sigma-70 family RNA polymerase sigma factor [Nonomuraea jiangxiensis]|uniref:RNA polymerase sigma-70 factor, ECF subfamily n=1 Tax=Nonomuraea jiangxiensis TaxID=633440 RepID=A0A1G9R060_9ACTN|nr:sigma-70 family RNA polymerase sigma factor [Nonomuraea jiangxiensis]SDM15845.1 RNA polymerase sigma-70 factor, ECF subfamily [Nonomuraea jiangxiensis]
MDETTGLAERFEQHRPRLRAVAWRMLGSAEADDAVQDAWVRLSASDAGQIHHLGRWLTTVVARECLHVLRTRRYRREEPFGEQPPDPVVVPYRDLDPEQQAMLSDSVGLALLVVLDRLTPAERLAFVLHDMFEVPFEEIADLVGRTPAAARQLASRARRRVRGAGPAAPDADLVRRRQVVDAFFAAARAGDFDALVQVLDPDVVLRTDFGSGRPPAVIRGVAAVAKLARQPRGARLHPALVDGTVGAVITRDGRPFSILAFTVVGDRIVEINGIRDPARVSRLASAVLRLETGDHAP